MITQKITCDHCGTEVPNVYTKRFSFMATNAVAEMGTIDACSKEHLGIALAKMFGISINGEANELLDRKQRELTKLTDANNFLIIDRDNMRARVAELESRIPANEVTNAERAQYDQTIGLQQKRITDLEKRLAEMAVPPTVDGKTPGQVFGEAFRNGFGKRVVPNPDSELVRTRGGDLVRDYQREQELDWANAMEIGAIAVLRAFGNQGGQTESTNAAETLRRVMAHFVGESRGASPVEVIRLRRIVDDEIATLEATPPSDATTPKFFATEHELRGSYFCTEFPFRPYLHVGRDIEFDDIPRLLKLGRNDVIEIRVVQRAKQ